MKKILFFLMFFILILFGNNLPKITIIAQGDKTLKIVENAKSDYSIVIPDEAVKVEKFAAQELQKYLKMISGVEIPIVEEKENGRNGETEKRRDDKDVEKYIYVGKTKKSLSLIGEDKLKELGEEGILIKTERDNIILTGGTRRGTLYAVYTFLEDYLGCRWYAYDYEYVPKQNSIVLPNSINYSFTPPLEYRTVFSRGGGTADWAVKVKLNSFAELNEEQGGSLNYFPFVHTFNSLVPPEKYLDSHPEYYSMIDGKRERGYAQLCLTNPEVREIALQTVLSWIKEHPEAKIFSVSQNDNILYCRCPKCSEIDEREGSHSGALIDFVNYIAEKVYEVNPDIYIDTLAYQYSQTPPKNLKPYKNVIVRLCHMAPSCDVHPIKSCFWNTNYYNDLRKWSKITNKIYVWHYVTNFSHFAEPFPNFNAISEDISTYHNNGVRGIFAQSSADSNGGGEFENLRSYLVAKLLWNPNANSDEIVRDFIYGYYGKAGEPIYEYFNLINDKKRLKSIHGHLYSPPEAFKWNVKIMKKANSLFKTAIKIAKLEGDKDLLNRVEVASLPVEYLKLVSPDLFQYWSEELKPGGTQDQYKRLERFFEIYRRNGFRTIREGEPLEKGEQRLKEIIDRQMKED